MKDEIKISDELAKVRHKCKCGHTVTIPHKINFVYCGWCNRRVYRDNSIKFRYKIMQACGRTVNEQVS